MTADHSTLDQLQQRLVRRDQELHAARTNSQALFQHIHVDDLVEQALQTALSVVDAQVGSVLLADPESKTLVFYCSIGEKPPPKGTALPWDKGIAGSVFQTGNPIVTRDVKNDQRHWPDVDEITGYATHDLIAIPLKRWEGEPIGVLEVINKRNGVLNQDDVSILSIISAFTAISIEEAQLFEEARLAEVVRVLGDIGHDVKNMLMPVLCGASLLKNEVNEFFGGLPNINMAKAKDSHEMCLDVIGMLENNARRIEERVTEIALCVKGLSSPPTFSPCQISQVVNEVFEVMRFPAQELGITLSNEGLDELPQIMADEGRLFNAFYNLVHNALAEVPSGGSITIRGTLTHSQDGLLIEVIDTGRGMPKEILDSLFSSKTLSRKVGGTGLGTKIVKDVVEVHGGKITVKSESGSGTTFFVELPLKPPKHFPRP